MELPYSLRQDYHEHKRLLLSREEQIKTTYMYAFISSCSSHYTRIWFDTSFCDGAKYILCLA